MDDDTDSPKQRQILRALPIVLFIVLLAVLGGAAENDAGMAPETPSSDSSQAAFDGLGRAPDATEVQWVRLWKSFAHHVPLGVGLAILVLVGMSAFFSGSETAFFALDRLRLRSMRDEGSFTGGLVAGMMVHPGRLLTTILTCNIIVNVFIGVLLGARIERVIMDTYAVRPVVSYSLAVAICTVFLVFFGEIAPKIVAVRTSETLARMAAAPLLIADRFVGPLRNSVLWITNSLFRVTHFHELRAAPYITDEELKSVLTDSEKKGVIEEDERQMIQGILEFSGASLREILTPRTDVVALPETATVSEALDTLRQHEYSRMPVYRDDLDHVTGVLVAKDLIPSFAKGDIERQVSTLTRSPHFVPETMTVQQFVKDSQRRRVHLAVVVDEYGGTSGIVTLEDAVEEVVGDIPGEDERVEMHYAKIADGEYLLEGNCPLDDLSELIGATLEDEEHSTLAGFLMNQSDKVLEPGDQVEHDGILFIVEECAGKRAKSVRVRVLHPRKEDVLHEKDNQL